jgi:hypothetical protein
MTRFTEEWYAKRLGAKAVAPIIPRPRTTLEPGRPLFPALCKAAGLPAPVPEYRFHPVRLWRFDYAWPSVLVAVEQEGGIWSGGAHARPAGIERDIEKYNAATLLGWRILRYQPQDLALAILDCRHFFKE